MAQHLKPFAATRTKAKKGQVTAMLTMLLAMLLLMSLAWALRDSRSAVTRFTHQFYSND